MEDKEVIVMIDKRSPVPLYIQLKEEIMKKIKEGVYEVDGQIPTEKEFMELYDLGRATVRDALGRLVNEGYLYKKKGIGTFVGRKEPSLGFEPLISLSYSLKLRGIAAKNIVEEKRKITPEKDLLKKMKWKNKRECLYLKRLRFAEDIPLAIEESYFEQLEDVVLKDFDLQESLVKIMLEDLKITIDKVEQVVIPRRPTEVEQLALKIDSNMLVLEMERWIYANNQKEPVHYMKFLIPNNIYTYPLNPITKK